eukprot:NODE_6638_length_492_cov_438.304348.p2 GENE.NODE_6638_length_492_cov_438.304348~~NODE_6638_length_492_cov_438.304348.p2  ORF type:complete len:71 (+),score=8.63 NODE_6638_length_492_cov_438.304348:157-369(+)
MRLRSAADEDDGEMCGGETRIWSTVAGRPWHGGITQTVVFNHQALVSHRPLKPLPCVRPPTPVYSLYGVA